MSRGDRRPTRPWDSLEALNAPQPRSVAPEVERAVSAERDDVAARYFPDLDLSGWSIRFGYPSSVGRLRAACDPVAKVLWVSPEVARSKRTELRATLIHELGHIEVGLEHAEAFRDGMNRWIRRARELKETGVVRRLTKQLEELGQREITEWESYGWVNAYLLEHPGEPSFEEMVYWMCVERAHSPAELIERYPRMRAVYDEELARLAVVRDALERARAFHAWVRTELEADVERGDRRYDCCRAPETHHARTLVRRAKRSLDLCRCQCGAWWIVEDDEIWMGGLDDDDVRFLTWARLSEEEAEQLLCADDPTRVTLPSRAARHRRGDHEGTDAAWVPHDLRAASTGAHK